MAAPHQMQRREQQVHQTLRLGFRPLRQAARCAWRGSRPPPPVPATCWGADQLHQGPGCSLPIIKYRLQRLFNRKIMTSIVSYDTIGKSFESTATKALKFRRYWENGFMSIYTDIPYLLRGRHRLGKAKQGILAARRKRFSLRMSGMSLVTLGNIAYSYFQLCNSTALFG